MRTTGLNGQADLAGLESGRIIRSTLDKSQGKLSLSKINALDAGFIAFGAALNVSMGCLVSALKLPLYLDSIGDCSCLGCLRLEIWCNNRSRGPCYHDSNLRADSNSICRHGYRCSCLSILPDPFRVYEPLMANYLWRYNSRNFRRGRFISGNYILIWRCFTCRSRCGYNFLKSGRISCLEERSLWRTDNRTCR